EERKVSEDNSTEEYDSYINFVKSELMNNKEFKGKNLGEVLNSGVKIYTNMDKDVQQTLQDRVNNGSYYKNEDQQVGASIVDSESGGLVAVSGGRNYKDVVDRNLATDAHPTGSSLKPFLAYGPAIENMNWATNHAIQDEESYQVDGVTFRNYDMEGHGEVKLYDALRQSFNIPALKTWQSTKENAGNDAPKQFANNVGLDYEGEIGPSEVLGGSSSEFSPTQLASAFAAIANGGEYNSCLNVDAKSGTGTYGNQTHQEYELPDDAAKDVWMNGFTPKYSMSVCMGFNEVKQCGVNSFVGHEEQEYPQFLFEDVMSTISPRDGQDFTKPDSVNGDSKDSLSVAGHSDDNTTSKKPQGQGGSSSSNSNSNSNSD